MRKISFSKQNLLFLKIHYRISVKIWDYPPRRMCWRTFQNNTWALPTCNCRIISQHHSPENHPVKFLSQPFSFFQKIRVMHSHLIYRLPGAYENVLCHFNTIYITHANISSCIYLHNLNHKNMLYKFSIYYTKN